MYHMARRAPPEIATVTTHPQSLGFPPRNIYINDPESTTTATSYYRTPVAMNVTSVHPQTMSYVPATVPPPPPPPGMISESMIDKAYLTSTRGILKVACLLFCFVAFICVVTTPQCNGNHAFLASVAWLVIIMQMILIIAFLFRFKTRFPNIEFEFLDFFATVHDAIYLLVASSVTIHYCRNPGQVAGGVMGIFAFILLAADAVVIFLARRDEPTTIHINSNIVRT